MNATAQNLINTIVASFKGQPVPTQMELRTAIEAACKPYFNVDVNMIERHVQCEVAFCMPMGDRIA